MFVQRIKVWKASGTLKTEALNFILRSIYWVSKWMEQAIAQSKADFYVCRFWILWMMSRIRYTYLIQHIGSLGHFKFRTDDVLRRGRRYRACSLSTLIIVKVHQRLAHSAPALLFFMMTSSNENIFCVIGPLCGEFAGHRWIPHTKASDAALWCFRWYAQEWTVKQTIVRLVIWDAIAPIMMSL